MSIARMGERWHGAWRGNVIAPSRATRAEVALVVSIGMLFAAAGPLGISWLLAAVLAGLSVVSVVLGAQRAAELAALCAWWLAVHCAIPFRFWPSHLVIVLAGYLFASGVLRRGSQRPGWQRWGTIDSRVAGAMVICVIVPAIALVTWWWTARPDLADFERLVPRHVPLALIFVGIVVVAVLNAATEELMFRGAFLDAFDSSFGAGWGPVLGQALIFGVWHFRGFPSGPIGVALAFVFGTMMGGLRRLGRGMRAPWIAHVFADITIYVLVTLIVVSSR